MTKMKSKKMTKSTFAIIIMAVAMVAMLAFGGTYAYFTAQASAESDTITTAKIALKDNVVTLAETEVLPGETIFDSSVSGHSISVTNSSDRDAYVYFVITLDTEAAPGAELAITGTTWTAITSATDAENGKYVYGKEVEAGTTDVKFDGKITFDGDSHRVDDSTTGGKNPTLMGATITVELTSEAIQKDVLPEGTDIQTAYALIATNAANN